MAGSRGELVRVRAGRPAFVEVDGVRVYISPHDEGHKQTKAEYKRRMAMAHPDKEIAERVKVERKAYEQRSAAGTVYRVPAGTMHHAKRRGGSKEFRRIRTQYRNWLEREKNWYARYGLTLP